MYGNECFAQTPFIPVVVKTKTKKYSCSLNPAEAFTKRVMPAGLLSLRLSWQEICHGDLCLELDQLIP